MKAKRTGDLVRALNISEKLGGKYVNVNIFLFFAVLLTPAIGWQQTLGSQLSVPFLWTHEDSFNFLSLFLPLFLNVFTSVIVKNNVPIEMATTVWLYVVFLTFRFLQNNKCLNKMVFFRQSLFCCQQRQTGEPPCRVQSCCCSSRFSKIYRHQCGSCVCFDSCPPVDFNLDFTPKWVATSECVSYKCRMYFLFGVACRALQQYIITMWETEHFWKLISKLN